MILLAYFISLYIGVNIRLNLVLGIIEALAFLIFVFKRFNKKIALISLLLLLSGVGLSFIRPSFNKNVYQSIVIEVKDNYYIASSTFERFYIYEKEHQHEVGDVLLLKGYKSDLKFNQIESAFDFKVYLNRKGVYQEFKIISKEIKFSNPIKIHAYKKWILSKYNIETRAMIKSIVFGESESEITTDLFKELHLTRLITNSGIFLSLFLTVFTYLAGFYLKEKGSKIAGLVIFVLYSFLTFPRFIVLKFVVLNLFKIINEYALKKRFKYIELLSISGILFLLIDYHYGYQDSFFLGYFIPLLAIFFFQSFKRFKRWQRILIVPFIITISFIPFAIKYYHEISILSVFLQYLMIPFIYIYAFISLLGLVIPLGVVLDGYTSFIYQILNFFKPALFKIYCLDISIYGITFFEFFYVLMLYLFSFRFYYFTRRLLPPLIAIYSIYVVPFKPLLISSVSFIDVGQGNSCLIHTGMTTIMIDTGGNIYQDIAKDTLIPFLKKNQIYDIDYLITTHDDYDHSGAKESLINNYKVKKYIDNYQSFPIYIGGLNLINYNIYKDLWIEENDSSLVISFVIHNKTFLIMGDAPIIIEKEIIKDHPELDCDYLLVGHHGSNTSSDSSFIKQVSPIEAIISCGYNNKYGHPHDSVLKTLRKEGIKIRRTDLDGTIAYSFLL